MTYVGKVGELVLPRTSCLILVSLTVSAILMLMDSLHYPSEAEARLNNMKEFSPYLKENITLHYYKNQLVNAV
jgi:hypothetical protein